MSRKGIRRQHTVSQTLYALMMIAGLTLPAKAQIYNWQTAEVIPGTESITPAPGVSSSRKGEGEGGA